VFQRLEARVAEDGLWLRSTAGGPADEAFQVKAAAVGREHIDFHGRQGPPTGDWMAGWMERAVPLDPWVWTSDRREPPGFPADVGSGDAVDAAVGLSATGEVRLAGSQVQFVRSGLREDYAVSMDGVRQDFVLTERPGGVGDLRIDLRVAGARASAAADGVRLVLEGSGRELAYHRLHVTDLTGHMLSARLEVLSSDRLVVRVADQDAVYPVRIDPTFSDADWVGLNPGLPGANGEIAAMAMDGAGNLYVGGMFTFIGSSAAANVAKWDGTAWSALGSGVYTGQQQIGSSDPIVRALAVIGSTLYVGGRFTRAGGLDVSYLAKWDGSGWAALGSGVHGAVRALAVNGLALYAGGYFTQAGGAPAGCIAKWEGNEWTTLGTGLSGATGMIGPVVEALAVSDSTLYAGGDFGLAGGLPARSLAQWNGSAWSSLGSGLSGGQFDYTEVTALATSGGTLYATGNFSSAGGVEVNNIARWSGAQWSSLGSGLGSWGSSLAVDGSFVYAGGGFSTAGGKPASCIARWNGVSWSALGSGMEGSIGPPGLLHVSALLVGGGAVYAGGAFATADGVPANSIARLTADSWSALGSGINSEVLAIAIAGSSVYVGGNFTAAIGAEKMNHVAQWNGDRWSGLGSGVNGRVTALAASETALYAGGEFTSAGAVPARSIAKWNGTAWSALGSGLEGGVWDAPTGAVTLAIDGATLFAGGNFTSAGGIPAGFIARWNGSAWSTLGAGTDGIVRTILLSGSTLYAGGNFTMAGGQAASRIARWDGSAWSSMGLGMDQPVLALATIGNVLYAGGSFTLAGGGPASRIAQWNGAAWSPLGDGLSVGSFFGGSVSAMAVIGTTLYVGGDFVTAGGVPASSIAQWDDGAWFPLGSGMGSPPNPYAPTLRPSARVHALMADHQDRLFVGGDFYTAGTTVSPFIALAAMDSSVAPGRFENLEYSLLTGFRCRFTDATVGRSYRIQFSSSLATNWTDLTEFTYTAPISIADPQAVSVPHRFYRAVTP
jgi:hypothetical protein